MQILQTQLLFASFGWLLMILLSFTTFFIIFYKCSYVFTVFYNVVWCFLMLFNVWYFSMLTSWYIIVCNLHCYWILCDSYCPSPAHSKKANEKGDGSKPSNSKEGTLVGGPSHFTSTKSQGTSLMIFTYVCSAFSSCVHDSFQVGMRWGEYMWIPWLPLLWINYLLDLVGFCWIILDLQDQHPSASAPEPGEWQGWGLEGSQIHRWPKGRGPWLALAILYQCQS